MVQMVRGFIVQKTLNRSGLDARRIVHKLHHLHSAETVTSLDVAR
jgi:hypothetical protein